MPNQKQALYDKNGEVIGTINQGTVEHDGCYIIECPKRHLYLIRPEELRQPDPPECPACAKRDQKNGD